MAARILLVDFDPLVHHVYGGHLKHAGFEIVSAYKAQHAVEMASAQLPQVIVVDTALPDMDGISLLRHFRKEPATAQIPVVVVTSLREYKVCEQEAKRSGAAAFLPKPFSPAQLLEEIRRLTSSTPPKPAA